MRISSVPRRISRVPRRLAERLSLTQQVALLSLVPMVALGFILAHVLQQQVVERTLADADESAQLIARIGIQPLLSPRDLRDGLGPVGVRRLDEQLAGRSVTRDLARIKIWNDSHTVIYSDDHALIGRTLPPSDDLQDALEGRPDDADVVTPSRHTETASEVGLGRLVEVYVPLRFSSSGPVAGVFEIYLSYAPIATALARSDRVIVLFVAIGLALLWAMLFRIVARAAQRLRRQSEENYALARYDQLTGLPNRTLLVDELNRALARNGPAVGLTAVLLIDVDGFKAINDTLGHAVGDEVLCEVGRRLQERLPHGAVVARPGGDEYAIVAPFARDVDGARAIAATIQSSMEPPTTIDDVALNIEVSIGVAVTRPGAADAVALLEQADAALDRARAQRSRIEVYTPEHDSFDASGLILLGQVREALQRDQFVVHYQPEFDLASRRIVAVEALLRWQHPEQGMLQPSHFIPLIEQTALVGPVAEHVTATALDQLTSWEQLGLRLSMSVNLSARNLLQPDLPEQLGALLRRAGVEPGQLTVEVTESATMVDPERAASVLQALRDRGIEVAIDDFGTGHASIGYLARLPATEIKIDRSLIGRICSDRRAAAIVRSTVDLARHLGLRIVAEGIETQAVLDAAAGLGCDIGQGFLVSRPLPAEELTARMTTAFGDGGVELRALAAAG